MTYDSVCSFLLSPSLLFCSHCYLQRVFNTLYINTRRIYVFVPTSFLAKSIFFSFCLMGHSSSTLTTYVTRFMAFERILTALFSFLVMESSPLAYIKLSITLSISEKFNSNFHSRLQRQKQKFVLCMTNIYKWHLIFLIVLNFVVKWSAPCKKLLNKMWV